MRTDLVALAERKCCLRTLAENDKTVILLSVIACQLVLGLLFIFPAFADAIALCGQY